MILPSKEGQNSAYSARSLGRYPSQVAAGADPRSAALRPLLAGCDELPDDV